MDGTTYSHLHGAQSLALTGAWTQYIPPLLDGYRNNVRLRHVFGLISKWPHPKRNWQTGDTGHKRSSIVRLWMCSSRASELCDGLTRRVDTATIDTTERRKEESCFFETSDWLWLLSSHPRPPSEIPLLQCSDQRIMAFTKIQEMKGLVNQTMREKHIFSLTSGHMQSSGLRAYSWNDKMNNILTSSQ